MLDFTRGVSILMTSASQKTTRIRDRFKSLLLYVLLGIVVALSFLGLGFTILGKWGAGAWDKWGGLTLFTLGLFAFFVCDSEKFLRQWRFWAVTATLLAGHLVIFAIILTHVEEWRRPGLWGWLSSIHSSFASGTSSSAEAVRLTR